MSESQNNKRNFRETCKESWKKGCETGRNFALDRSELRKEIAGRIRKCRMEARLTQEEVSEKIDANPLTYKGYENCRSDIPTVYLVRIADLYGVSVDFLVGRTENSAEAAGANMEERIAQLEKLMAELRSGNIKGGE